MAVFERTGAPVPTDAPQDFRVVAFVPTYNESDIISHTLQYLTAQGINAYVIDNWSSDDTLARARQFTGRGLIGLERFPPDGPTRTYEWRQMLGRVEDLAQEIAADWFVLHDADERRHAPWPGVDLKAGLYHADRCGFTCVDHVVVNFWPTGEELDHRRDVEDQLRYFSFSDHPGHYHQRKGWKNTGRPYRLPPQRGTTCASPGGWSIPSSFCSNIIQSGPRNTAGAKSSPTESLVGTTRSEHWDGIVRYQDVLNTGTFLRDRATLEYFEETAFAERYLIQRLSGIGVFAERPTWATGPREKF